MASMLALALELESVSGELRQHSLSRHDQRTALRRLKVTPRTQRDDAAGAAWAPQASAAGAG